MNSFHQSCFGFKSPTASSNDRGLGSITVKKLHYWCTHTSFTSATCKCVCVHLNQQQNDNLGGSQSHILNTNYRPVFEKSRQSITWIIFQQVLFDMDTDWIPKYWILRATNLISFSFRGRRVYCRDSPPQQLCGSWGCALWGLVYSLWPMMHPHYT